MPAFLASLVLTLVAMGPPGLIASMQTYFTLGFAPISGNIVLWSLSWEEVVYAVFAILFIAGFYKRPLLAVVALCVCTEIAVILLRLAWVPPVIATLLLPASFLLGNLFYLHRRKLASLTPKAATLLMLLSVAVFLLPFSDWGVRGLLVLVLAAGLLCFGARGPSLPWRFTDISYGVYIYNWPVVMIVSWFIPMNQIASVLVSAGATILVSWASSLLLEQPALRLKNAVEDRRAKKQPITA